jgi:hypothetical protein
MTGVLPWLVCRRLGSKHEDIKKVAVFSLPYSIFMGLLHFIKSFQSIYRKMLSSTYLHNFYVPRFRRGLRRNACHFFSKTWIYVGKRKLSLKKFTSSFPKGRIHLWSVLQRRQTTDGNEARHFICNGALATVNLAAIQWSELNIKFQLVVFSYRQTRVLWLV